MVARAQETVSDLSARDSSTQLKALRSIKNQVIGHKGKKLLYLRAGVLPRVVDLLSRDHTHDTEEEVLVQSATTVGSLAYGVPEAVDQLLTQGGLTHLVTLMASERPRVVEAAVRAVKLIVQSPLVSRSLLVQPAVLSRLVSLLGSRSSAVAGSAAGVLAKCCDDVEEADVLVSCGAGGALFTLLVSGNTANQVAALEALLPVLSRCSSPPAALGTQVETAALTSPAPGEALHQVLRSLLRDPLPRVRFLTAACVTYLPPGKVSALRRSALLVLLQLLASGGQLQDCVPPVLAHLVKDCEELQKAAAEADVIRLLATCLSSLPPSPRAAATSAVPSASTTAAAAAAAAMSATAPATASVGCSGRAAGGGDAAESGAAVFGAGSASGRDGSSDASTSDRERQSVREGVLRALGSLCMNRDASRKQLIEAKALTHIVRALEDGAGGTRAAAAMCVMALTRSVRTLRSTLLTNDMAVHLIRLLEDPCGDVKVHAAAAMCNLVLEFSSVKEAVLQHGGLRRLAGLSGSTDPSLRLHSVWALRNLVYKSSTAVRTAFMQELSWAQLGALLADPDVRLQEQAMCILRNLSGDGPAHIDQLLVWAEGHSPDANGGGSGGAAAATVGAAAGVGRALGSSGGGDAGGVVLPNWRREAGGTVGSSSGSVGAFGHRSGSGGGSGGGARWGKGDARLTQLLSAQLDPNGTVALPVRLHALYTVVNILTGSQGHKSEVVNSPLLHHILHYLRLPPQLAAPVDGPPATPGLVPHHGSSSAGSSSSTTSQGVGSADLRLPAVWCIINLTWPSPQWNSPPPWRAGLLRMGTAATLRTLAEDERSGTDLQERARTALQQLEDD